MISALVFTKKTTFQVKHSDLEKFICEVYGLDSWSYIVDMGGECSREQPFVVDDGNLPDYDQKHIRDFLENGGRKSFNTGRLLDDCCSRGLLEKGFYCIISDPPRYR